MYIPYKTCTITGERQHHCNQSVWRRFRYRRYEKRYNVACTQIEDIPICPNDIVTSTNWNGHLKGKCPKRRAPKTRIGNRDPSVAVILLWYFSFYGSPNVETQEIRALITKYVCVSIAPFQIKIYARQWQLFCQNAVNMQFHSQKSPVICATS